MAQEEVGLMFVQIKECRETPETGRETWNDPLQSFQR